MTLVQSTIYRDPNIWMVRCGLPNADDPSEASAGARQESSPQEAPHGTRSSKHAAKNHRLKPSRLFAIYAVRVKAGNSLQAGRGWGGCRSASGRRAHRPARCTLPCNTTSPSRRCPRQDLGLGGDHRVRRAIHAACGVTQINLHDIILY